jgi:prepilin signal peptidase PulO-like enzyme (type II secretory pathway)
MDGPMILLVLRMAGLFAVGACLGSLVNWAAYTLAWNPRPISPWAPPSPDAPPRRRLDRLPILGWLWLNREARVHGPRYWLRPMLVELCTGIAVAALYWWEIDKLGLVQGQAQFAGVPPLWPLYLQFASHTVLLCLMLAASLIDADEKIIPDEITVVGTMLGLILAAVVPMSLLPHVDQRPAVPVVGVEIAPAAGGAGWWLEPVTPVAPREWPAAWADLQSWPTLLLAAACYLLWCFALAPRLWRGGRGAPFALRLIAARVWREFRRPPLAWLVTYGMVTICMLWLVGGPARRTGLVTALVGLAASGGIVWAVRLIGTAALKREAMGFGDVTLMMMIGTFLGWQACLILFFLAPFAGLIVGLMQFVLRRDDVIPYGPFLCLAAAVVVVAWAPIWNWARPMFELGWLVPIVLVVCLVLLGLVLAIWQVIKGLLFGWES